MRFHFATIPVHGSAEAEHALNAFLASHRVLNVERHLIADGAQSAWALCVAYVDASSPASTGAGAGVGPGRGSPGRKERIDYREALDEAAFAQFAKLRAWRKLAAERDGVPPYAVFTNEQLAEIVRVPVQSLAALAQIEGIGSARVDKYGAAVLETLRAARGPASPATDAVAPST